MSKDLGSIHIEIELETKHLLDGVRKSQRGLGKLSGVMENISSSTRDAESSMFSFSKAAQVVASSLNAGAIITAIDGWGLMASRIKTSLKSVEGDTGRYAEVQERFLEISNRNGKAIETTQSLYVGSATSMKEMGYNTAQTMDYIESLSSTFTANATSAQQTESAMTALNNAMVTGTLSGNDWDSVLNGIPSSVGDVAQELTRLRGGFQVTESEVRQMAANGGLDMKLFVDALINAKDANNILADSMNNTLAGGFTKLSNSAQAYYGELSQSSGVTDLVSAGFSVLSDNFDKVAAAANIAALVVGARMANALAGAGKEQLKSIANSVNQAKAELESAKASEASAIQAQRRAAAEVKNAQLDRARLQNTINNNAAARQSIIMSTELTAAKERERAAKLGLFQANTTLAASSAAVGTASRAASVGVRMASGALNLVGGPMGIIAAAAAGWYIYEQNQAAAKKESIAFADTLPDVIEKLKGLNLEQLKGTRADTLVSIKNQREALAALEKDIVSLTKQNPAASWTTKDGFVWDKTGADEGAADREIQLAQKVRDLDSARAKLNETLKAEHQINIQLNQSIVEQMRVARDNAIALEEAEKNTSFLGGAQTFFAEKLGLSTQALKAFNSESLKINWGGTEGEKLLKQAKRRLELTKLEGEARVKKQVEFDAEDAGVKNPQRVAELQNIAAETYRVGEARSKANAEGKKSAATAETVAEKLANLKRQSEQAAESTNELSRAQAIQKTSDSLGKLAKPEEIKLAEEYAAKIWDISNAQRALSVAENLLPERQENSRYEQETRELKNALDAQKISRDEYNIVTEKAESQHQLNLAKIRSESVISPQQEAAGMVDPVQQLANENARKLALIQQFETDKTLTEQQAMELRNAANRLYEQQRLDAQWELFQNQSLTNELLATSLDGLQSDGTNAILGLLNGSQSLNESLANVGATILNSVVGGLVQMGIDWVKSQIMASAANSAAAASAATTGASITASMAPAAAASNVATMGGASAIGLTAMAAAVPAMIGLFGGARYNGGPVTASSIYRVGENGKPEIFKANNGNQYMIPGDNGRVISNRDIQGGEGGSSVVQHITFEINTTGGIDPAAMTQMESMMKRVALFQIHDQATRPGGKIQPRK